MGENNVRSWPSYVAVVAGIDATRRGLWNGFQAVVLGVVVACCFLALGAIQEARASQSPLQGSNCEKAPEFLCEEGSFPPLQASTRSLDDGPAWLVVHGATANGMAQTITILKYPSLLACGEGIIRMEWNFEHRYKLAPGALVKPLRCSRYKPEEWR